ncbi:Arm DNA-binding domain-containing protein [Pseudomonas sp. Pseusp3]|uniref:Arm DNA-binding domain-containing protein n=1 Tax=unclassified Pseudomonas TaxID=196821 RepID=UPI0039B08F91
MRGRQAPHKGLHPVRRARAFLLVKATGTKVWRFKYKKPSGKPGLATFGNYPALNLKAARARRVAGT